MGSLHDKLDELDKDLLDSVKEEDDTESTEEEESPEEVEDSPDEESEEESSDDDESEETEESDDDETEEDDDVITEEDLADESDEEDSPSGLDAVLSPLDEFIKNSEGKEWAEEAEGLKAVSDSVRTAGKRLLEYEQNVTNIVDSFETEVDALLNEVGLDSSVLEARNWPDLVKNRFKKKYGGAEESENPTSSDGEDELDDDSYVSKKHVDTLVEKAVAARLADAGRPTDTQVRNAFVQAAEHYWEQIPLLRKLGNNKEHGAAIKQAAIDYLGEDYGQLLGADGSGLPIRHKLNKFVPIAKNLIRAAGGVNKERAENKQNAESGARAMRKGRTPVVQKKKGPKPRIMRENSGHKYRADQDEVLEDFDREFLDGLGPEVLGT